MPEPAADQAWREGFFNMLWSRGEASAPFDHPGWKVYRNTTQRSCIESLKASYPALRVLLGDESFGVLALAYLNESKPTDHRLLHFGATLPDFLAHFEPAQPWPQLVDVAKLDRMWCESHVAADAPPCSAAQVLQSQREGRQLMCMPHPATRWHYSPEHPIATLWMDARAGLTQRDGLNWQGQGVLLTRCDQQVQTQSIDEAVCVFLQACKFGCTLEQALLAAHAADPQADLPALFALLLQQQALIIVNGGDLP